MPLIDCGELVDVAVELGEGGVEVRGLFAEQKDKDGGVVVETLRLYVVERLPKVLVGPRRFPEPEHAVLNADPIVVLQGIKPESAYVAEAVEVDRLELILKDLYNFLLRGPANRRVMLVTLGRTSPMIPSSSAVDIRALAPKVVETAATAAATRASDSFTINSCLSLAFTSAAANSASSLRRVSSKRSSFCSFVIGGTCVAGTCIVAVESGMEEVMPALESFLEGILASLYAIDCCSGVCKKKSKSR